MGTISTGPSSYSTMTSSIGPLPSSSATARAVAEELGKGPIEEVMVEYDEGPVLMVPTGKGPVLMVLLDQVASLGRVRLALKRVLPALKEELP